MDETTIHSLKEHLQSAREHVHTLTHTITFQNVCSWLISEQICGYLKSL